MLNTVAIPGLAYAEANWGRWISRCPTALCTNAVQITRRQQRFECAGLGSCGWTSPIVWPDDPEMVEAILGLRPDVSTRNWQLGESLNDLVAENGQHGLMDSWEGGLILETWCGRAVAAHPTLAAMLPEYRRLQIGA
jgi:hypothetical protein